MVGRWKKFPAAIQPIQISDALFLKFRYNGNSKNPPKQGEKTCPLFQIWYNGFVRPTEANIEKWVSPTFCFGRTKPRMKIGESER